jgi:hypothetical protein
VLGIRIPFNVNMPWTYTFSLTADYGHGAFIGVDGAEFTGGEWAHSRQIEMEPVMLSAGEYEFKAFGFEDYCNGAARRAVVS